MVSEREYTQRLAEYVAQALEHNAISAKSRVALVSDVGAQLARQADDIRAGAGTSYLVACDIVRAVDEITNKLARTRIDLRAGVILNAGTVLVWAAACASSRRDRNPHGWEFDGEAYVKPPVVGASMTAEARSITPPDHIYGYRGGRSAQTWVIHPDLPDTPAAQILYVRLRSRGVDAQTALAATIEALIPVLAKTT